MKRVAALLTILSALTIGTSALAENANRGEAKQALKPVAAAQASGCACRAN